LPRRHRNQLRRQRIAELVDHHQRLLRRHVNAEHRPLHAFVEHEDGEENDEQRFRNSEDAIVHNVPPSSFSLSPEYRGEGVKAAPGSRRFCPSVPRRSPPASRTV
jgi:hypothetical protein